MICGARAHGNDLCKRRPEIKSVLRKRKKAPDKNKKRGPGENKRGGDPGFESPWPIGKNGRARERKKRGVVLKKRGRPRKKIPLGWRKNGGWATK